MLTGDTPGDLQWSRSSPWAGIREEAGFTRETAALETANLGSYKPDPRILAHAGDRSGVSEAEDAAHIGDRRRTDEAAALDSRMRTVRYGGVVANYYDGHVRDAGLIIDHHDELLIRRFLQ